MSQLLRTIIGILNSKQDTEEYQKGQRQLKNVS